MPMLSPPGDKGPCFSPLSLLPVQQGILPKSQKSSSFSTKVYIIRFFSCLAGGKYQKTAISDIKGNFLSNRINISRHSRRFFICGQSPMSLAAPVGAFYGLPAAWGLLLATLKRVYKLFHRNLILYFVFVQLVL